MSETTTTRYDVAEHLRTPEEMAAYLEACLEEVGDDAAFIAKAPGSDLFSLHLTFQWVRGYFTKFNFHPIIVFIF